MVGTVAAQTPVTAALTVPEGPFTVGDPLELMLVVTHPAGYQVITPEIPETWDNLRVVSQSPATTIENADGSETTGIKIDARIFAPGEFSTPPLVVSLTDGSGQLSEVTAAPAAINISSVLVEGDTELRDIKPQAEMPFTNLLPWITGGLLLAAAVGGFALWWRRRQARLALAAIDNRLPHEVAQDTLREIERMGLPEQARFKEHYTLVSDTVRHYVKRAYEVPMMERTTSEIQTSLKQSDLTQAASRQLVRFLEESDLVKFSKFQPTEATAYELIAQARAFVEATKPIVITEEDLNDDQPQQTTGHTFSANGTMVKSEVSA
jgi:hypothetical protein